MGERIVISADRYQQALALVGNHGGNLQQFAVESPDAAPRLHHLWDFNQRIGEAITNFSPQELAGQLEGIVACFEQARSVGGENADLHNVAAVIRQYPEARYLVSAFSDMHPLLAEIRDQLWLVHDDGTIA